jgi:hypothetical protein
VALTDHEIASLRRIEEWENNLLNFQPNDFQLLYHKYVERAFLLLPDQVQKQFFSLVDGWLFHLHSAIQGSQLQLDAKERILSAGRTFNPDIAVIADLKVLELPQLQYIAGQQIARHRFYSFAQGGLTGTGGTLVIGTDIPAMAVINLRAIQLIAMTYGYEINTPYEMMNSLKIFHAALLPKKIQKSSWQSLMTDLEENRDYYFYEGNEQITDVSWIEQPIYQILKAMVIVLFRKKEFKDIPLISILIGASSNYSLTRKVTEFAHNYYQLRYLREKEGNTNEYT